jgi:Branched-chain amino acid transport system / permease component
MTLAMMQIAAGISALLVRGQIAYKAPDLVTTLGSSSIGGVPWIVIVAALMLLGGHLVLTYTRFGRYIYMVGGNREAAEYSGLNVKLILGSVMVISAVCSGIGGMLGVAQNEFDTYLLDSIAVSMRRGGGTGAVEQAATAAADSIPLEEIRSDVGFLLDRIVIAIDAVGHERVAGNDRVVVELHRVQSDRRGMGPGIPFERGCTLYLFTGCDRFRKDVTFNEGFHGPELDRHLPVDIERRRQAGDQQNQKSDDGSLKNHSLSQPAKVDRSERNPHQLRQPLDIQIARIIGQHRGSENDCRYRRGPDQLAAHLARDRCARIGARRSAAVLVLAADPERQRHEQHDPPQHEVDREPGGDGVDHR